MFKLVFEVPCMSSLSAGFRLRQFTSEFAYRSCTGISQCRSCTAKDVSVYQPALSSLGDAEDADEMEDTLSNGLDLKGSVRFNLMNQY